MISKNNDYEKLDEQYKTLAKKYGEIVEEL